MTDYLFEYGYAGLFVISFLAATILPIGSETIFAAMILARYDAWLCIIAASIGNWLGGMTNYYLGLIGKMEWIERGLKIRSEKIKKMHEKIKKWGAYTAFFSFLPIVGDIIPLALGFMRANVHIVYLTMFLGKFCRYVVLMYGITQSLKWLGY